MKIIRRIKNRILYNHYRELLLATLKEATRTKDRTMYNKLMDVAEYYGELASICNAYSKH